MFGGGNVGNQAFVARQNRTAGVKTPPYRKREQGCNITHLRQGQAPTAERKFAIYILNSEFP